MPNDNETIAAYRQRLILGLRLRDVSGRQIGEALAEMDSHLAETGEDPHDAFGDPDSYADRLSASFLPEQKASQPGRRQWLRTLTWHDGLTGVLAFAGAGLFAHGLVSLVGGTRSIFGLAPVAAVVIGPILIAVVVFLVAARSRRRPDRIVDPRTGADVTPPLSGLAVVVLIGVPIGLLAVAILVTLATR